MPTDAELEAALRRTFPDPGALAAKLHALHASFRTKTLTGSTASTFGLSSGELARAEELIVMFRRGETPQLTREDRTIIAAVIWKFGRPALFIDDGRFVGDAGEWAGLLEGYRTQIEATFPSVGRIQTGASEAVIGTGFVVGDGLVMTNRHVADKLATLGGRSRFAVSAGAGHGLDFRAERIGGSQPHELVGVEWEHRSYDAAVLRFNVAGTAPAPLTLSASKPATIADKAVYVVGHPVRGGASEEDLQRIFQLPLGVKRLSPGNLMRLEGEMVLHDASTLGGSSGSCVVDLGRHSVLGLHAGGSYLEANEAVPMWRLSSDPDLARLGVAFE